MAVWLKLTLSILAGLAGLLVMFRTNRDIEATLEQTLRHELQDLREHLFDR
jgi:hypothetical protein